MAWKQLTRGACAAVITFLLAACGGSGTVASGGAGTSGTPAPGGGTGTGTGTNTGTQTIQGVAMPASVSVVTATNAAN
jgi:hypothetical protein